MSVVDNLHQIQSRILQATKKSAVPHDVTLIAVSKLQPLERLVALGNSGFFRFGENYVQELIEKDEAWPLATRPEWHLIGPLQTNKVKFVVGKVSLIHTVDRTELAETLSRRAQSLGVTQDILIQIKIGNEETKHGILPENAEHLCQMAESLPGIRIRGLMTLPPLTENESQARVWFRELVAIQNRLSSKVKSNLQILSMGTSGDFELAVEEGATLVRVGTAIFGERPKAH